MDAIKVGDRVEAVPPFQLRCGSGRYSYAVCVCSKPLMLISEQGDMLWSATLYDGCVKTVGVASEQALIAVIDRLTRTQRVRSEPNDE